MPQLSFDTERQVRDYILEDLRGLGGTKKMKREFATRMARLWSTGVIVLEEDDDGTLRFPGLGLKDR